MKLIPSSIFHLRHKTLFRVLYLNLVKHFSFRRAIFTLLFLAIHLLFVIILILGRILDELLFPAYRKTNIEKPVFIISNPRSGTTLLHRLLCLDEDKYTYTKLYHTILPCVSYIIFIKKIARVDRKIGAPLHRLFTKLENILFSGWKSVHPMGFNKSEEDETLFVWAGLSPAIVLLSPWTRAFKEILFLDQLNKKEKAAIKTYYLNSLKRIKYATDPESTFLIKNVFSTGRVRFILDCFPDARIIYPIRHPYKAVPSLVSMFSIPWKPLHPDIENDSTESRQFADLAISYYRYIYSETADISHKNLYMLTYESLIEKPKTSIQNIYRHFNMEYTSYFDHKLTKTTQKSRKYKSKHKYSLQQYGLSKTYIDHELGAIIEKYWPERITEQV